MSCTTVCLIVEAIMIIWCSPFNRPKNGRGGRRTHAFFTSFRAIVQKSYPQVPSDSIPLLMQLYAHDILLLDSKLFTYATSTVKERIQGKLSFYKNTRDIAWFNIFLFQLSSTIRTIKWTGPWLITYKQNNNTTQIIQTNQTHAYTAILKMVSM